MFHATCAIPYVPCNRQNTENAIHSGIHTKIAKNSVQNQRHTIQYLLQYLQHKMQPQTPTGEMQSDTRNLINAIPCKYYTIHGLQYTEYIQCNEHKTISIGTYHATDRTQHARYNTTRTTLTTLKTKYRIQYIQLRMSHSLPPNTHPT